jgi:hypothetical protein
MDATIYFRLTDRIREAMTPDELTRLGGEIDRVDAHEFERRALRKLVERRGALLSAHAVTASV